MSKIECIFATQKHPFQISNSLETRVVVALVHLGSGNSLQMVIERVFGMLKGRWRILLKRVDTPLRHVPNLIITCLSLKKIVLSTRTTSICNG